MSRRRHEEWKMTSRCATGTDSHDSPVRSINAIRNRGYAYLWVRDVDGADAGVLVKRALAVYVDQG